VFESGAIAVEPRLKCDCSWRDGRRQERRRRSSCGTTPLAPLTPLHPSFAPATTPNRFARAATALSRRAPPTPKAIRVTRSAFTAWLVCASRSRTRFFRVQPADALSVSADLSPLLSPRPRKCRYRAKASRNHNPRVGGSSPSSGIPFLHGQIGAVAKDARIRRPVSGPNEPHSSRRT
jgi:hypothetical protein